MEDPGLLDNLEPGESRTLQMAAEVASGLSAPVDDTPILNRATVSYIGGSASARKVVVVKSVPSLMVGMVEDRDPAMPASQLIYTMPFSNPGGVSVPDVVLRAPVPFGSSFISASGGGVLESGTVRWNLGTIPAGGINQRWFTVEADALAEEGSVLQAWAEIDNGSEGSSRANAVTVISAESGVTLSMTANPDPVRPNEQIFYTLTLSNTGLSAATNVVVTDSTPDYTRLDYNNDISDGGRCYSNPCDPGEVIEWVLGNLEPGESRTLQMAAEVASGSSAPVDGTLILNNATVTHDGGSASASKVVMVGSNIYEHCMCDFEPDGDVDGLDLKAYILDNAGISIADFAAEFGKICP